jgi:hypothetical protein
MVALLSGIGSVGLLFAGLIYWDRPIPRWITLVVSALCFVFAAIRIWGKERQNAEAYKEEIRKEREQNGAPRVIMEFSREQLPYPARSRWVGERPIFLKNIGKSHAYGVRVDSVVFNESGIARFVDAIPIIDPGQLVPIRPEVEETSSVRPGVSEFEVLLQVQWTVSGLDEGGPVMSGRLTVPMRITYHDQRQNQFSTELQVHYDLKRGAIAEDFLFLPATPLSIA